MAEHKIIDIDATESGERLAGDDPVSEAMQALVDSSADLLAAVLEKGEYGDEKELVCHRALDLAIEIKRKADEKMDSGDE